MRAVFDTNVVISACFWRGAPFDCLKAWAEKKVDVCFSPSLLAEYQDVYEELCNAYPDRKPVDWVAALSESADLVFPSENAAGATPDRDDEMVLECALAGEVDFLVSGDKKHLLKLKTFRGIPIVDPTRFLWRLKN